MTNLFIATVLISGVAIQDWLQIGKQELAVESKFTDLNEHSSGDPPSTYYLRSKRSSDLAEITLTVRVTPANVKTSEMFRELRPSMGPAAIDFAASGYPLGTELRNPVTPGGVSVASYFGDYMVEAGIGYRGKRINGRPKFFSEDPEGDKIAVEGLARRTLARLAALSATAISPYKVNGKDVPAYRGLKGETLVNIDAWCNAKGYKLTVNARQGICWFDAGGAKVTVPLAARKLSTGSRWIASSDISISVGQLWFVPLAALEEADGSK